MPLHIYTVGDSRPAIAVQIIDRNGSPMDITGATFAGLANPMRFKNVETDAIFYGSGSCAVVDASTGLISYTPAAADFTAAREGEWFFKFTIDIDGAAHYMNVRPVSPDVRTIVVEREWVAT